MKKYLGFIAVAVFLLSCADDTRDNPYDMRAVNYYKGNAAEPNSSSTGISSSSREALSSSSVEAGNNPSSSSIAPSSNSVVSSSSSALPSSSSIAPSSSSVVPSSSSARPSSSSSNIAASSSSSVPSSSSLGGGYTGSYGSLLYESQTYKTVVIGTQTWFAENLNYNVSGSKCYGNSESNCTTYGRLYDWSTAMGLPSSCNTNSCSSQIQSPHRGICPSGWHIPSQAEWNTLSSYVQSNSGCSSCDARLLKATSGWNSNGNGTDQYGFSALPGGRGSSDGSFYSVGDFGLWWSASESNSSGAYYRGMYYYGDYAYWDYSNKSGLFSVRCLQD